jgi:ectoine hydroxylase-related dioxygenase (phytanoyl-CoA dioxygenase family)
VHLDYKRPLFSELPNLVLPFYMMVVSFGLTKISAENGPVEVAPGTHKLTREEALAAMEEPMLKMHSITMDIGDVLIRHPWVLHRGTPNKTDKPRPLVTIRYVRDWYYDSSRATNSIPSSIWASLSVEQKAMLRFPRCRDNDTANA